MGEYSKYQGLEELGAEMRKVKIWLLSIAGIMVGVALIDWIFL
jgi:predicted acetyltransferase